MKGKILLLETSVELQNKGAKRSPNVCYPLGMAYLDAILKKEGYKVITKDYSQWDEEESMNEIKAIINDFKPGIVGISVMTMTRVSTYRAITEIKKINPDIKIILGGIHPSLMYEQLLLNYPIEAVVIGEGEKTAVEIIDALYKKKSFQKIKGIAYLRGNKVIKNPERELIEDLDSIPFPSHDIFMNPERTEANILSSRGCPFKCSFCCLHNLTKRKYRKRGYKCVVDEIEYISKNFPQIKEIAFADDTFTLDNERAIVICKEIMQRGLNKKFKFLCSSRIKPINYELLKWMSEAGFKEIKFGIETGSRKILESIHKGITPEEIIETFKICSHFKNKIRFVKYLMVGFPGETWETVEESVKLTKEIHKYVPMDFFYATPLWIYPGQEIYETMKLKGQINDDYWLTDKPVPRYTIEHPEEELFKMANYIALKSAMDRGNIFMAKLILNKLKRNPKAEIKRIINTKFGLNILLKK